MTYRTDSITFETVVIKIHNIQKEKQGAITKLLFWVNKKGRKTNMKTKITLTLTGLLVSFLTPLAVLVPQASAAADTCTWTGLGTGVEDITAKTWTFNVSDVANWSVCDNGNLPEAGDILIFPANLADVDPTDANINDSEWKYIVSNDLLAGTSFAGIQFTGDAGSDCSVYDDQYAIVGNAIGLSGDVANSTIGTCAGNYNHLPYLDLSITTSADISISVSVQDQVAPHTGNTLNFGAHNFSLCDVADTSRTSRNPYFYTGVTGTGTITFACSTNWNPSVTDTFGDVVVESSVYLNGSVANLGKSATRTFTFKDGAQIYLNDSSGTVEEFKSNIVFEGSGANTSYCKSTACTGADNVVVTGSRGNVYNYTYDVDTQKSTYYGVNFTGDITLSDDTVFSPASDMTISGAVSGDFTVGVVPGSRGKIIMQSSDNQSGTPNGTIKSERYDFALSDPGYDVYVQYGQNAILTEAEEIANKITVYEGGILKGVGKVAGIDVQTGGTLAPGNSPGCIVSNGDLTLSGSYDIEIAGKTVCTEYDQTDVTGAVDVTGGTLNVAFLSSFVPALNDEFMIIKNDAADAVTGTFTGLVNGASVVVAGITFQINYDGGDGNDVTLTATAVPATVTTPDTGIGQIMQSPIMTLIAVMLSAGMLLGIKRIQSAK